MSLSLAPGGSSHTLAHSHPVSPTKRTQRPIVTGTSVLGIKYADGVMLAADTLCSFGSMAKHKDVRRLISVNTNTLLGASGDYSDFQAITDLLKRKTMEDKCLADSLYEEDAIDECARETCHYLRAVMYSRRTKMNPLWNSLVVAGFAQTDAGEESFLGVIDKIGTTFEENCVATGLGVHLALPIMRDKYRPDLEEGEARAVLEDCMRVLFYRDARALNRIQIAKVTKDDGVLISDPFVLETSWEHPSFVVPKGDLDGTGCW